MINDKERFLESLKTENSEVQGISGTRIKERLKTIETRQDEIEKLMCRIYEDMSFGNIPEKRYERMNEGYERE